MVLRIGWNVLTGLVERSLNKQVGPKTILKTTIWKARTGLLDCDVNLHLNNSSYFYAMELSRWHLTAITGLLDVAVKNKMMFLVASQAIRCRHPIAPFTAYEVHSNICYWDDSWTYFSHRFFCPKTGKLFAEGLVRACVTEKGRRTSPQALLEAMNIKGLQPPKEVPPMVQGYLQWDQQTKYVMEQQQELRKEQVQLQQLELQSNGKLLTNNKWMNEWKSSTNWPLEEHWLEDPTRVFTEDQQEIVGHDHFEQQHLEPHRH